jgi:GH25 family lysozyme M1 (1,4-beta-N-acetylmuramidase)
MANPIVVDLSHHNPTPDWTALKEGGTVGVILKATEGTSFKDKTLYERGAAARKAGLKSATYHFLRPGSIAAQMDFYLSVVDPLPGERVVLDHEDAGVSLSALEQAVTALLDRRPDLQVAIYSGHLIKEQLGSKLSETLASNTSLWIAQYTSAAAPSWPKGTWATWSLWQYTDQAQVEGISAKVDGNRWNGTTENLLKWFGPAGEPIPEPVPPEPEVAEVLVTITTQDNMVAMTMTPSPGVKVRVLVDGEPA